MQHDVVALSPRIASGKMLPEGAVASSEMLPPAGRVTIHILIAQAISLSAVG
jgi:hypothetical protein